VDGGILQALLAGARALWDSLWRAARQVFHEVTGLFFLLFALVGAAGVWREWSQGSALWILALTASFTLAMAYFAASALWSSRRVR
jgi:hypothetical protein